MGQSNNEIKKKQEELKYWLKESNISITSFSERVFYELYDSDNQKELDDFKEVFKKYINRGKKIERINTYLEILYQQPEFLKLGHTKTIFLFENDFSDEVNQKLKVIYKLVDDFVLQADHIIEKNKVDNNDDIVLDILFDNTKKSYFIFKEIVCLIQSQFFSGAYARWRSLHELFVLSYFIKKHGKECAIEYIKSIYLQGKHIFDTYINAQNKFQKSERFTDDEINKINEFCNEYFKDIKDSKISYNWASSCLKKPSFANMEKDVGLEHLHTFYKMASMLIHGNITLKPESIVLIISHPLITFYDTIHIFLKYQVDILYEKKNDNYKEKIIDTTKPLMELKSIKSEIEKKLDEILEYLKNK